MVRTIESKSAPAAIGPYSQAVVANGFMYLSGMLPLHPETGEMIGQTAVEQTKQIMENITGLLGDFQLTVDDVIKTTIFLADINDFGSVNEVYGSYFSRHKPARSCVEVAAIPKGARVEIEVIALCNRSDG